MRIAACLILLALSSTIYAADVPPDPDDVKPGMERCAWALEPWGNSGSVEKENRKMLKLIYTAGSKDKAGYRHLTCFSMPRDGKFTLDVYSGEDKPPEVSFAVSTTQTYEWHESLPRTLKKGWNRLQFSVGDKNWKTKGSGWRNEVAVDKPEDIRAVDLLVMAGNQTGIVYVQGINYDLDEKGKQIAALTADLQSDDVEKRGAAEKAITAFGRPAIEALTQLSEDDRPEVMLRAASALRHIEEVPEQPPADPAERTKLDKQKEEQKYDDLRRQAQYTLHSLDVQRTKLLALMKETQTAITEGRAQLDQMKFTDAEQRKVLTETLDKLDEVMKELQPISDVNVPKVEPMKKKK
jgi:hypothetical protein